MSSSTRRGTALLWATAARGATFGTPRWANGRRMRRCCPRLWMLTYGSSRRASRTAARHRVVHALIRRVHPGARSVATARFPSRRLLKQARCSHSSSCSWAGFTSTARLIPIRSTRECPPRHMILPSCTWRHHPPHPCHSTQPSDAAVRLWRTPRLVTSPMDGPHLRRLRLHRRL